MESETET